MSTVPEGRHSLFQGCEMLQILNSNMIDYRRVCDKDAQPFNLLKIGTGISYSEQCQSQCASRRLVEDKS